MPFETDADIRNFVLSAYGTDDRLALLLRGGAVRRYHAEPAFANHVQTVAEHSWRVAMIVAHLWPDRPALVLAALYHDAAEGVFGDVPAPVKKILGHPLKEAEHHYEAWLEIAEHLKLEPVDHARFKCADTLDLVLYCENVSGAEHVYANGVKYLIEHMKLLPVREHHRIFTILGKDLDRCEDKTGQDHPFGFDAKEDIP
jgi:5'-deoxynucleotidase YfbR-like HD superfamily hydrolase